MTPETATELQQDQQTAVAPEVDFAASASAFTLGEGQGGMDDFSDLVEGGAAATDALKEELAASSFGSLDINDFHDFSAKDYVPTTGEYRFALEQKWLREGTSVIRQVSSVAARGNFGGMKVTLYKGKIRLATFSQSAFCEIFLPVFQGLADLEQEVSFIFDQGVMAKIASSFGDAIIEFTFFAEKSLLEIKSGNTKLELSTFPPEDFVDYHAKLGTPQPIARLDPVIFKNALKYANQFVRKDDISANLSIVDVRNGLVIGGSYASVGLFTAKALEGLNFKVKFEALATLEKLLGRMHQTNTRLFDAGSFYMIRDENMYFGFEKSQFEFPAVDSFQNAEMGESLLVQRPDLINSLNKLSVVSIDRDMLVRLQIEGLGKDVRFELSTADASGRRSTDRISGFRSTEGGRTPDDLKQQVCYVNLHSLLKVASHFETANINLKFDKTAQPKVLFLIDTDDDTFTARTVMTLMTQAQVDKMQAEKNMSALEKAKSRKGSKTADAEAEAEAV